MNFIQTYDNCLDKNECNEIIDLFDRSENLDQGETSAGLNLKIKQCKNLDLTFYSGYGLSQENNKIGSIIYPKLEKKLILYRNKFPFLNEGGTTKLDLEYHISRFDEGDGYYKIHCEQGPTRPKRMLVWMIYLNDAKCGTKFYHQRKTIRPKTGRLVVWPAAWTHMHSGVTPNKGIKYIVTGWISYT